MFRTISNEDSTYQDSVRIFYDIILCCDEMTASIHGNLFEKNRRGKIYFKFQVSLK